MDEENRRIDYRQNSYREKKNFNLKKPTIETLERTTGVTQKKNCVIGEKQREYFYYEDDDRQLRGCVLNKLWDSVPPEARILPNSQSDSLDSDETESGSEQRNDDDNDGDGDKINAGESQINETNYHSTWSSQGESCFRQGEDPNTSWEINFDFIQAIIWLKSTVTKLQRIPAREFCKVFRNQWELSEKITSNDPVCCEPEASEPVVSNASPIFRRPLNLVNREFPPTNQQNVEVSDTKQCEKVELLKYRLTTSFDILPKSLGVDLIPETDESETASVLSISSKRLLRKIRASETVDHNSTVDSGFNSEKPESADSVNTCHATENIESRTATAMEKSNRNLATIEEPAGSNSIHLPWENLSRVAAVQTGRMNSSKRRKDGILTTMERKSSKRPKHSISSALLKYVLRSSECNQLLFRSVKAILNVLTNEKSSCSFKEWHGSVQKEAIDAIVSVVYQLDKEKGPDLCRREVVSTIEKLFKGMLRSNELDKATIWEHHRFVVLELCNAFSVCVGVIDYLVEELKNLIQVATQINEQNLPESLDLLQKSTMIFHSLEIVLKKYKAISPSVAAADEEKTSQRIPEVTELWKRDSKILRREPDVFVAGLEKPKNSEDREKAWTEVLEELAVVSTRYWPLVKVLAWQCLSVIKSSRDG